MACMGRFLICANNEPKSALVRDLGNCRDNKGKPAKCVFSLVGFMNDEKIFHSQKQNDYSVILCRLKPL